MKKIVLTSLLSIFVATSFASAATTDNPMYRPDQGKFYSITSLETNSDYFDGFRASEQFGFGITDRLSVYLNTSGSAAYASYTHDDYSWDNFGLYLSYRYFDDASIKADVYGGGQQMYDKDGGFNTFAYDWKIGTKVGYVESDWTIAGFAEVRYMKDDMKDVNIDATGVRIGLDGQYLINSDWNLIAGIDYTFSLSETEKLDTDDQVNAKLGVNYNFTPYNSLGIYATRDLNADSNDDAYGLGIKFGFEF